MLKEIGKVAAGVAVFYLVRSFLPASVKAYLS
jgi:hypothetical protein